MSHEHLNVTIKQAVPLIGAAVKANQPFMLWGSPGVGKTSIVNQVAAALKFKRVVTIVPSQIDVIDLSLPFVFAETITHEDGTQETIKRSGFALSEIIPADPNERSFIYVDEINTAATALQPKLMSLLLKPHRIGTFTLPPHCRYGASGNWVTDKGAAQRMATTVADRLGLHLNVIPDRESWCNWALRNDIAPQIIAFVRDQPDALDGFDPNDVAAGCTPRSLEALSDLVKAGLPTETARIAYYGSVGHGMGSRFESFVQLYDAQISADAIIADPENTPIPETGDAQYCVCSALCHKATTKNFDAIYKYAKRLHASLMVMLIRDCVRKDDSLIQTEVYSDFTVNNADLIVDKV